MIRFLNVAPSIIITPVFVHPSFRKAKLPTLPLFYKLVRPSNYLGSKFLWNMATITSATDSTGCWREMWWPLKTRLVCMYSSRTGEWHTFLRKCIREAANELRCAKTENWPNVAGHRILQISRRTARLIGFPQMNQCLHFSWILSSICGEFLTWQISPSATNILQIILTNFTQTIAPHRPQTHKYNK